MNLAAYSRLVLEIQNLIAQTKAGHEKNAKDLGESIVASAFCEGEIRAYETVLVTLRREFSSVAKEYEEGLMEQL